MLIQANLLNHRLADIYSRANDQYSTGVPTPARDTGVGNLFSPIRGERKRNYTTSVPHRRINRFDVAPSERRYEPVTPKTPSTYNLADQTPRTVHQPQLPMSPPQPPAYHSSPFGYESGTNPSDPTAPVFAFGELREHAQLWTGGNLREMITPSIHCKSEKGLFFWEGEWIAYRRNYFSFSCEYTLGPKANQSPLWVQNGEKVSQVQALGVCLSAAVDGANGKKIELVQFTAKRDQGPKTSVAMRKIFPVPPPTKDAGHFGGLLGSHQYAPMLPLQQVSDNQTPQMAGQLPSCSTLFERLQFKSATANNGKRRAQQQYFHINAELWADIRLSPNDPEQWVRVASRTSESVVVRGRSPSHYKLQANQAGGRGGGHGNNHRGGGAPGGAAGGMAGGSHLGWSSMPGYPGSGRGYSSMPNSGGGKSSYGGSYHRAADGIDHHGNAVDDLSPASSRSSTMMGPPTIVPVIPPATFGPPQFGPPLQRSTDPGYSYYNPSLAPRYDSYVAVVADMPRPIKTDAITPVTLSTTIETNTITATTNANSTHDRYEKPILGSSKGHYTTVSNTF